MGDQTHLLMGIPTAGKTSFLAAFWYAVRDSKDDAPLTVEVLPDHRTYLNAICDKWLAGEELDHPCRTARDVRGLGDFGRTQRGAVAPHRLHTDGESRRPSQSGGKSGACAQRAVRSHSTGSACSVTRSSRSSRSVVSRPST